MKTKNLIGALILGFFAACGSDPPVQPMNPYNPLSPGFAGTGGCLAPQGVKDRTLVANFGNGATLILDLYRRGTQIEAIGELNIPSIGSLYGLQYMSQPVGAPNQQVRATVCTNGALGTLKSSTAYEDIEIALRGNGVYIEMGSRVGPQEAYVVNEAIEGNVYIELNGGNVGMPAMAGRTFLSVRP